MGHGAEASGIASMIPRLYREARLLEGEPVALAREEAHYLGTVLRRRVGDKVRLFNAVDGEFEADITKLDKRSATLGAPVKRRAAFASPPITLAIALIKRSRLEAVVEKATEMGCARIQPVETRYAQPHGWKADRMAAIAREAAEQTERFDLPDLADPIGLDALLGAHQSGEGTLAFADETLARPDVYPPPDATLTAAHVPQLPLTLLIGPEGGFSPEERAALLGQLRLYRLQLGPRILRADTAAIAALTLIQLMLGDW
jgi:16S rRNA (uracil1498-N3)-methyltransferase